MSGLSETAARPTVAAIVVNWNRPADTARCLRSLLAGDRAPEWLIVVDNASSDDSPERLRAEFPTAEVVALVQNRGFCGGYNVGLRRAWEAGADWAVLTNDDAVAGTGMLRALMEGAQRHPEAAFLGPLIYTLEEPGRILAAGGRLLPSGGSELNTDDEPECHASREDETVDFLSGSVLLVRRAAVEQIGLLDEDYFAYWEDVDWCLRAQKAGWASVLVRRAEAWHPDTVLRDEVSPVRHYYLIRNQLLLARKHGWAATRRIALWARAMRMVLSWSLRPRWADRRVLRGPTVRALWDVARGYTGEAPPALRVTKARSPA